MLLSHTFIYKKESVYKQVLVAQAKWVEIITTSNIVQKETAITFLLHVWVRLHHPMNFNAKKFSEEHFTSALTLWKNQERIGGSNKEESYLNESNLSKNEEDTDANLNDDSLGEEDSDEEDLEGLDA